MNRAVVFLLLLLAETTATQPSRILIAYESTAFKKELVDEMLALFKKDSADVTVIEHSKGALDSIDPSQFNAVFITNSGVNSKVRPWVLAWLEKHKKLRSRVLLHTTQTRAWEVTAPVDAVTSASEKKRITQLAKEYSRNLKQRIGRDAAR